MKKIITGLLFTVCISCLAIMQLSYDSTAATASNQYEKVSTITSGETYIFNATISNNLELSDSADRLLKAAVDYSTNGSDFITSTTSFSKSGNYITLTDTSYEYTVTEVSGTIHDGNQGYYIKDNTGNYLDMKQSIQSYASMSNIADLGTSTGAFLAETEGVVFPTEPYVYLSSNARVWYWDATEGEFYTLYTSSLDLNGEGKHTWLQLGTGGETCYAYYVVDADNKLYIIHWNEFLLYYDVDDLENTYYYASNSFDDYNGSDCKITLTGMNAGSGSFVTSLYGTGSAALLFHNNYYYYWQNYYWNFYVEEQSSLITDCSAGLGGYADSMSTLFDYRWYTSFEDKDIPAEMATLTLYEKVDPSITSVDITTLTSTLVYQGNTIDLDATVSGLGNYEMGVTWSIQDTVDSDTTIDANGLLTIGSKQSAGEYTIIATAAGDSSVTDTITISVLQNTYFYSPTNIDGINEIVLVGTTTYGGTYYLYNLTKNGYKLLGYAVNGEGDLLSPGAYTWNFVTQVSFVANWELVYYTLDFDVNNGSGTTDSLTSITYDSAIGTLPIVTRTGYTFDGWYIDTDKITSETTWYYLADQEAVAQWTANDYELTFDANSGDEVSTVLDTTYDAAIGTLPVATRTGYTFNGWYIGEDEVTSETIWDYTADQEAVAQWTANDYELTFDANSGDEVSTVLDTTYDAAIGTLPVATRTGYTFDGWYIGEDEITSETIWDYTADQEAEAQWIVNSYKLSFDADGGDEVTDIYIVVYDDVLGTLPVITKPEYNFEGWKIGDVLVDSESIWNYTDDQIAVAQWSEKLVYPTTSGDNQSVTEGESKDVIFEVDANLEEIEGLYLNDELVDPENYTIEDGKVVLNKEYVESLPVGEHTFELVLTYGSAFMTVEIAEVVVDDAITDTSDMNPILLYIVMMIASVSIILYAYSKKGIM